MLFVLNMILFLLGLFIIIRESNLIKKVIGLNIFQSSVFIFYLIISKVALALIIKVKQKYNSIEEHELDKI